MAYTKTEHQSSMKYTQIKVKKKIRISGEGAIPGTPKRVPSQ